MNAIKFIKEQDVEKAMEVIEGAPEFPVFGYCALTGSYIFKRKDATAYYHNETNSWSEEYALELILLEDLKRLVESVELVAHEGGLDKAKNVLFLKKALGLTPHADRLEQAIADYESIYSNDMGDDSHIENHISPLCKVEVK